MRRQLKKRRPAKQLCSCDESTEEIEAALAEIEETNRKVRANMDKARALDDARELAAQYEAMSVQLKELRRSRTELLTELTCRFPDLAWRMDALLTMASDGVICPAATS